MTTVCLQFCGLTGGSGPSGTLGADVAWGPSYSCCYFVAWGLMGPGWPQVAPFTCLGVGTIGWAPFLRPEAAVGSLTWQLCIPRGRSAIYKDSAPERAQCHFCCAVLIKGQPDPRGGQTRGAAAKLHGEAGGRAAAASAGSPPVRA